jgi:hypothetical protein
MVETMYGLPPMLEGGSWFHHWGRVRIPHFFFMSLITMCLSYWVHPTCIEIVDIANGSVSSDELKHSQHDHTHKDLCMCRCLEMSRVPYSACCTHMPRLPLSQQGIHGCSKPFESMPCRLPQRVLERIEHMTGPHLAHPSGHCNGVLPHDRDICFSCFSM